jgi:hypothetical protein
MDFQYISRICESSNKSFNKIIGVVVIEVMKGSREC